MSPNRYDFIIVGGGSAGSVLGNRLSADPATRVLVLEAGRSDWRIDPFIHMPAALTFPIGSRFYDWMYESEPEPFMGGRRIYHARGKVLGGSSSINGQIFQRGNPLDYERWAADPGMASWDYAHCLPYFKRMETCLAAAPDDPWRGHDGPLVLERGPATNPLFDGVLRRGQEAGLPPDRRRQRLPAGGLRAVRSEHPPGSSAERGTGLPAPGHASQEPDGPHLDAGDRHPLRGVTRGRASRSSATAVAPRRIHGGEVILCGGAINSPQLLQLSGVGRAADLEALGIPVVRDLPGVGDHLQDHLEVYIQYRSLQPVSAQPIGDPEVATAVHRRAVALLPQRTGRHEPLRGRRLRPQQRRRRVPEPDVPLPAARHPLRRHAPARPGTATRSTSGRCTPMRAARSGSPARTRTSTRRCGSTTSPPTRIGASGSRRSTSLGTSSGSRRWIRTTAARRHPARRSATDTEILDWVRRDAETALHPSCTARMGVDDASVVDPLTMRVHGLDGLRVVDASVMPYVTNGNIYAPVMMLAEKAADLILGDTPLAPEPIPFYRHQPG